MDKKDARFLNFTSAILWYSIVLGILAMIMYLRIVYNSATNLDIDLDFGEGPIAYESWLLSQGYSFYFHYIHSSELVLIAPYPPLFQLFSAMLIRLGVHPLLASRLVSIISTFILGAVLYKILVKFDVNKQLSLLMVGLLFSLPEVFLWSPLARVDMLGVLLSILALYYLLEDNYNVAIVFMSLALLAKQSFVALPVIVGVQLLLARRYSQLLKLVVGVSLPYVALSIFVPYYLDNVILANLYQHLNFDIFFRGMKILSFYHWALIMIAVYSAFYLSYPQEPMVYSKYKLITNYFVLSLLLSTVSHSKPGSSVNYFIEPLVLALLLFALLVHNYKSAPAVQMLLFMLLFGLLINSILADSTISDIYTKKLNTDYAEMYTYIDKFNGTIFFEDPYLAFKTNKGPVFDLFLLTKLQAVGVWNQSGFIQDINNKKFSLIVTMRSLENYPVSSPDSRYTPEMVEAILSNYRLDRAFGGYYFYVPLENCVYGDTNETQKTCS